MSGLLKAAVVVGAALGCGALATALVYGQPADVNWTINGGENNIRYSPLTQVNKSNVTSLQVAWTYDSRDAFKDSEMQSNPRPATPRRRSIPSTGANIVIACGGGKNGAPSGSSIVAFALPK